jgi:hypothetical protein
MVELEDMENAARLIYETLLKLTPDFNFKYLD